MPAPPKLHFWRIGKTYTLCGLRTAKITVTPEDVECKRCKRMMGAQEERASEVLEENTDEDGKADEDGFKSDFSAWLKEYHEEQAEELNLDASVFVDLLNAGLSEVDWYELAEMYLDEAKEDS